MRISRRSAVRAYPPMYRCIIAPPCRAGLGLLAGSFVLYNDRLPSKDEPSGVPMFEQTFKNIDDVLWKEAGCTTELDYTEQTSWILFLKYLDDLEQERAMEAELVGKSYKFLIDEAHRWSSWAAPKDDEGEFDHDSALTGDDLIEFTILW